MSWYYEGNQHMIPKGSPIPGSLVKADRVYWLEDWHPGIVRDPHLREKIGIVLAIVTVENDPLSNYVVFWTGPHVDERITFEVAHRLRHVQEAS